MSKKIDLLRISADGGSRGNPGPSAVGAVLSDDKGARVSEVSRFIGVATNNTAEYLAVIYALHEAFFFNASSVELDLDSQLVAKQLKGEYRVKDQNMRKFYDLAVDMFRFFDSVKINEVPRSRNKEADALVNRALDLNALV
ncbi:MAG: reverse transcriptase-like protein [Candidatus Omnitrophica bacterium]|nr:reverse transcriptase-like protein [Candidatus Omnitrophota bacterium]